VTFVDTDLTADQAVHTDSGIKYNPGENALTVAGTVAGSQLQSTSTDNTLAPIIVASNKKVNNLQAATAEKWHSAMTLTVEGAVSGSVSIQGGVAPTADKTLTTALTATAIDALLPPGIILMWSGAVTNIPYGWVLCDGRTTVQGTVGGTATGVTVPDLSGRFIVGVGARTGGKTYALGNSGGSENAVIVQHSHTIDLTSGTQSAKHTHEGTTNIAGEHVHSMNFYATGFVRNTGAAGFTDPFANYVNMDPAGDHSHTVTTEEDQTTHTHDVDGSTASEGESGLDKNLPPYYALCYIIKIPDAVAAAAAAP
jgi:hypothetical protein